MGCGQSGPKNGVHKPQQHVPSNQKVNEVMFAAMFRTNLFMKGWSSRQRRSE